MVSPSLSATTLVVAIAAIITCTDGFVTTTPKCPSISTVGSSIVGNNNILSSTGTRSGRRLKSSSTMTTTAAVVFATTTTSTSLYSTQQDSSSSYASSKSSSSPTDGDGDDDETLLLQSLFSTYSDDNGFMSKDQLMTVPSIQDMLAEGDLLSSELDEIWDAAVPKKSSKDNNRIDFDSFIQVYRDIDDLFEDDEELMEEKDATTAAVASDDYGDDEVDSLSQAFDTLKDGIKNTISFSQLQQWEEITSLVNEGMLGEDEFKSLWESSGSGSSSSGDEMDLERFLKFNAALDDLFVFDDDDDDVMEEEDEADEISSEIAEEEEEEEVQQELPMITETDLPPAVLFSQLANENYLVGEAELKRWGELQEMISDGDLSQAELDALMERVEKAPGTDMYLDEEGFCKLAEAIDDLFEEVDEDEADKPKQPPQQEDIRELKEELLELLEDIDKIGQEEGRLLCGLDCTELEQERVLEVVGELEREPYNKVVAVGASGGGAVSQEALLGDWELLYSSSSTMKYNEGLSGLAGGLTRFGGLKQKIIGTKYLSDVEYTEQVIGKVGGKSFEVKITGDWELKTEISLFTGKPANVLSVTPDSVAYGPRRDKADHWKSLGPMNMLLLSYIDEDLRIMRGNTSTDTLFIWKRC